jgi:hypothetical protein
MALPENSRGRAIFCVLGRDGGELGWRVNTVEHQSPVVHKMSGN